MRFIGTDAKIILKFKVSEAAAMVYLTLKRLR